MIVKHGNGFHLMSADGSKHLGGPYASEAEAQHREKQVNYFKNLHQDIADHGRGFPK